MNLLIGPIITLLMLSAAPTEVSRDPGLPQLTAMPLDSVEHRIQLVLRNSGPGDIILISPETPSSVSDQKTCSVLVTSVVDASIPIFEFTPTQVRVKAGETWSAEVGVLGRFPKNCRHVTCQVQLAYLAAESEVVPQLTRDMVVRTQRVVVSEKFRL